MSKLKLLQKYVFLIFKIKAPLDSQSNSFAVIRTIEDEKFNYSTVLMKWLFSRNDGSYVVKWPNHYEKSIKEKAKPELSWQSYQCIIKARDIGKLKHKFKTKFKNLLKKINIL